MRLCFSLLPQARQEKLKAEKEAGMSMREDLLQQKERKKGLAEVRAGGGGRREIRYRRTRGSTKGNKASAQEGVA